MQLTLDQPALVINPGNSSGLKVWLELAVDFGAAEFRVAYWQVSLDGTGGWHLLGAPTANSEEARVILDSTVRPEQPVLLMDTSVRVVSVILTWKSADNVVAAVEADQSLQGV